MKDGELGEDDGHRELDALQKLTDEHITRIDELLKNRESEVMEV